MLNAYDFLWYGMAEKSSGRRKSSSRITLINIPLP
jgi:hypothetical protein